MQRPPRPRRRHDHPAPGALPGRAHHRAGSHQPSEGVEDHPGVVAEGVTVLLTTQYLDEADQLADASP